MFRNEPIHSSLAADPLFVDPEHGDFIDPIGQFYNIPCDICKVGRFSVQGFDWSRIMVGFYVDGAGSQKGHC